MPPGAIGPGMMAPGQMGPGMMPRGMMMPGQMGPGMMSPGQTGPGRMGPGMMPQGDAPGPMPEGMMPPMMHQMMQGMIEGMARGIAEGVARGLAEGIARVHGLEGPDMHRRGMRGQHGMRDEGREEMRDRMRDERRDERRGGMRRHGPGPLFGPPATELDVDRVRAMLQGLLAWHGDPGLQLGELAETEDGTITAEIRSVDGSLVQRLAVDPESGAVHRDDLP